MKTYKICFKKYSIFSLSKVKIQYTSTVKVTNDQG